MVKKQTNDSKIIIAMDALGKSIIDLNKFAAKYDGYIDEAAMRGDDSRAKQLIRQKMRVSALAEQLKTLKSHIELGAYTSHAISELGKLPAAIAGCKGLIAQSPDFSKLGKSIENIFDEISKAENELSGLNRILDPKPLSISSRLDDTAEDEASDEFKAEYAAMIERIKGKISTEKVVKPDGSDISATGDIDYAGIVAEENKKK